MICPRATGIEQDTKGPPGPPIPNVYTASNQDCLYI